MTMFLIGFIVGVLGTLIVLFLVLPELMRPTGPRWPVWVIAVLTPFKMARAGISKLNSGWRKLR